MNRFHIGTLRGLRLLSRTIITATGASTYTTPVGCRVILVECFGGGGGGRTTGNSTAAQIIIGGGGAGGGYSMSPPIATNGGVQFAVNVGVGGAANTNGGATNFQTSTVNLVAASAGQSGATAIGTGTAEAYVLGVTGPAGSALAGLGVPGNASMYGHRVSGTVAINSRGAAGPFGGQPVGNKAQVAKAAAGGKYGAGGAGGISVNAGGASTGGAGGQGLIIVWEFC